MNCITVLQIPATDYCNTNYMQFLLHTIVQSAILILVTGNSIIYQKSFFHKKFSGKNKTSAKLLCWGFQQRYKDSNLEMTESESVALPFGDSPLLQRISLYMKGGYRSSTFLIFFQPPVTSLQFTGRGKLDGNRRQAGL